MRTIVVYQSGTGFTAKYAGWIAERLGCEAKEWKKVNQADLASYDQVIYGGWSMGNMVVGLDKVRSLNLKSLVVFCVGITPASAEHVDIVRNQNKLENIPLYYYEGGINYEKLGFFKSKILKMVRKSIMKKENQTEQEKEMVRLMEHSFDHANAEAVSELVDACK